MERQAAARVDIVLSGPPRAASAILREAAAQRVVPVTLQLAEQAAVHSAYVRPFGRDSSEIRLRLPRDTPPGSYRGQADFGEEQRDVLVLIEPVVHLQLQPSRSELTAAAGADVDFDVEMTNTGNVPFTVPGVATFDLDDSDDQSRALGRTLRAGLEPGERRVDRLFEELRLGHGGEARVTVADSKEPLAPGESRRFRCTLAVPGTVQSGRRYEGVWQLADAAHVLVVAVKNGRGKEVTGG